MAVMNGLVIAIMKGIVSQPRCSVWRPVLACRGTMVKKGAQLASSLACRGTMVKKGD